MTPNPQIGRIARLLVTGPDEVRGLDDVPEQDLRMLHDQIAQAIFSRYQRRFTRVAELSTVLPGPVAGKLAERFLPPVLGARAAERLEPAKARDLVGWVSVGYLADLTLALDPTRSKPVVRAIPPEHVAAVARALFDRREYAAMAEFAATVTREALSAALNVATARDLLTVAPLLAWNDDVRQVIAGMPDARIDETLHEILAGQWWDQGSLLVERLDPAMRQRVLDRARGMPGDGLAAFRAAAERGRLGAAAAELFERADRGRA